MKKIRIKFSADLIIEAESIAEAREKWEGMNLFSQEANDCGVEFSETLLIEDAETYKDISDEWDADDEDGGEEPEEPDGMAEGLTYLREHLAQDEIDEIRAQIDRSYRYHMNPSDCCAFNSRVEELLEEYGEDNDLPEGWWMYEGDIDDWLLKL